jgi:hypothetical protein
MDGIILAASSDNLRKSIMAQHSFEFAMKDLLEQNVFNNEL